MHLLSKHARGLGPVTALGKEAAQGAEHLFASSCEIPEVWCGVPAVLQSLNLSLRMEGF